MDKGSADLGALADAIQPDDIATLIYTSGTTGPPKGVMISQYNVVYTVESLRECFGLDTFLGRRVVSYLPMAHIAERMMSHYQSADPRLQRVLLPRRQPAVVVPQGGASRDRLRRAAGVGEDLQRRQRRAGRGPRATRPSSTKASLRPSRSRRPSATEPPPRSNSTRGRSSMRWPSRNVRALDRTRRRRRRRHRCSSNPSPDPRVVQRDRRAAQRDLRNERVERPDDMEPATPTIPDTSARPSPAARWCSPTTARCCAAAATCSGLLRTARQDGRDHHRRMAALGRHRRARRRRLPAHRRSQEGTDHHLRRQEHQPGQPRSRAQDDSADRPGRGDRRQPQVLLGDPRARSRGRGGLGDEPRQSRTRRSPISPPTRTSLAEVQRGVDEINKQFAQVEQIKKFTLVGEEWLPDSDMLTPTSKLKRRGVTRPLRARDRGDVRRPRLGARPRAC